MSVENTHKHRNSLVYTESYSVISDVIDCCNMIEDIFLCFSAHEICVCVY